MLIFYKNIGILVIVYLIACFIGTAIVIGVLQRNVDGVCSKINIYSGVGLAFLFASIWTFLTKDDYYKDRNGDKKKMDTVNSLFFIKMGIWMYIFLAISMILSGNSLFHYFA